MSSRAELREQWKQHNKDRQARGYATVPWLKWKPGAQVPVRLADAMKALDSPAPPAGPGRARMRNALRRARRKS